MYPDAPTVQRQIDSMAKDMVIRLILLTAPFLVLAGGVLTRTDPLSFDTPWGFMVGFPLTFWVVRRCGAHSGRSIWIPNEEKEKVSALLFGFARTFEIIVLLWLPQQVFHLDLRSEFLLFLVIAKMTVYLSYGFWVIRLSTDPDVRRE